MVEKGMTHIKQDKWIDKLVEYIEKLMMNNDDDTFGDGLVD